MSDKKTLESEGSKKDFRIFLQGELVRRCQTNPRYSLRAFAKSLEIESSHLSKILRGQRPIKPGLLNRLGQKLNLPLNEIRKFEETKSKRTSRQFQSKNFKQLSQDVFESIEDWRHYAILELMKVRGFKTDPRWLAGRLGISVNEVHSYVDKLIRIGLLTVEPDGRWIDTSDGFSTDVISDTDVSYAHRRSQIFILKQAMASVESLPLTERDQSSMMMATSSRKLKQAKKMIQQFRRELCEFLEDTTNKDSVFQLSISLFPCIHPASKMMTRSSDGAKQ